jgi:TatD DNase family protein
MLFDTHAHLTDDRFRVDLPAVLDRASAADLCHIICVATTAEDSRSCVDLATRYSLITASVGIQPNHVAEVGASDWDIVARLATMQRVSAIGETGLDRHWDFTPFAQQQDYFERHLALARMLELPVIIHCREAEADTVDMLRLQFERHGPIRGVMHSFTGDWATAEACLAMGLFISFAGMVTYKNASNLRVIGARVPIERILIETDCPYLSPVPIRGQRNEPAFVAHTAACLAQERGLSVTEFAAHATRNAYVMFSTVQSVI